MNYAIAFTMFNQVAYSKAAVESIKTKHPYHLILVDDFSFDGTKNWTKQVKANPPENCLSVTVFEDAETNSLAEKWNMAASRAKELGCEAVLICNNDILFHPVTLDTLVERMEKALRSHEKLAIVTAHNRRGPAESPMNPAELNSIVVTKPSEAKSPDFSCFLITIESWEAIGGFEIRCRPCYFEDNFAHLALVTEGYDAITTTAAPYYHFGSITQRSIDGGLCTPPQFEANKALLKEVWGILPGTKEYDEVIAGKRKLKKLA